MSLEKYNPDLVPVATGLHNSGAICYMNAIFQCMVSCPSFNHFILDSKSNDPIIKAFKEYLKDPKLHPNAARKVAEAFVDNTNDKTMKTIVLLLVNRPEIFKNFEKLKINEVAKTDRQKIRLESLSTFLKNIEAYREMPRSPQKEETLKKLVGQFVTLPDYEKSLNYIKSQTNIKIQHENVGWQDSQEGFQSIIEKTDALSCFKIEVLKTYYCPTHEKILNLAEGENKTNSMVIMPSALIIQNVRKEQQKYLIKRRSDGSLPEISPQDMMKKVISNMVRLQLSKNTFSDEDIKSGKDIFVCKECNQVHKETTFAEILKGVSPIIIIYFNRYGDQFIPYFPEQLFIPSGGNKKYRFDIVAQVEYTGGHYYAIAKRDDGDVVLNDSSVSKGKLGGTRQTQMIFYHFIDFE